VTAPRTLNGQAAYAERLLDLVAPKLEMVEEELRRNFRSKITTIQDVGEHILGGGGKRLRPALLLLVSRMLRYDGFRDVVYGAVVEFIHTATLVHDDIIDESDLRRGRAAVHSRWGNDITVLLGDYLYIKSMALALTQDSLDVIRLLCDVTLKMIEGELFQLTKTGDIDISLEEHFDIIRRKTAHLFGGCSQIGGMLGDLSREQQEALWEYGFNLGIAFQLVDDLLDYTADESALGKPIGSDLREGKVTLPIINLLERGGEPARTLVADIVRDKTVSREQWNELRRLLAEHHATAAALRQAHHYASLAQQHLSIFPPSAERDALMALPDYILSRDR
jgi:octaprenyl-diphosphate synthase